MFGGYKYSSTFPVVVGDGMGMLGARERRRYFAPLGSRKHLSMSILLFDKRRSSSRGAFMFLL
jgi:hypothetical protein